MSAYSTAAVDELYWHPQPARPKVDHDAHNRGKLLIISEPDDQLFTLLEILDQADYDVIWRTSGEEAKLLFRNHCVPVVLCAQHLLQGNWLTLLEHVQHLSCQPRFILSAGVPDDRLWLDALSRGAYDVLVKPFDTGEVLRIIGGAFRSWSGENYAKSKRA